MNDTQGGDAMTVVREAAPVDGEPVRMLPAEAYTSDEVLAWERRHLFAGVDLPRAPRRAAARAPQDGGRTHPAGGGGR